MRGFGPTHNVNTIQIVVDRVVMAWYILVVGERGSPNQKGVTMGACNFIEFGEGKTAKDAFAALVQEAEWDYGHDPYNGTISTTDMSRRPVKVIQKTWGPMAEKKAVNIAKKDNWGEKWESRVLDCGHVKGRRGVHMFAFYGWAAC